MNDQSFNPNDTISNFSKIFVKFKEKDKRMKTISYNVIENPGSGDCLFHSIFDFVSKNDKYFANIPENVQNLRKMVVDFIIDNDENWNKWYNCLKSNIENFLPSTSSAESFKVAYKNYMYTAGNCGTFTELTAASELFGFNGKILRENEENYSCYDFGLFDKPSQNPKLFLFFTGPIINGHFRILDIIRPKCTPLIQNGNYYLMKTDCSTRNLSITNIPQKETENNNSNDLNIFKCNVSSCSQSFKSENGLKIHIARCHKDMPMENDEMDFANIIQNNKSGVKVIKRIPRGARISVALKLASLMKDSATSNSLLNWQALFLFPYQVLNINRSKHKSLTQSIKENVLKDVEIIPKNRTMPSLKNIIESKVAEGDIRGAIKILSSTESIAIENNTTFELLKEKHPLPSITVNKPNPPSKDIKTLIVTEEQVRNHIYSFTTGSAGGIDSLTPQHLKDLLSLNSADAGSQLLSSITQLCNLMISGKVNNDFIPYLYGARLIAFNKNDGGIRPIAVGSTLRRLVSKLCCTEIRSELIPLLKPKQLGFGVKGGSEAAIHSVRTYIQHNKTAEVIIKIDVKNAFNSLERVPFLKNIESKFPSIYPYMYQCYAAPSNLFYNKSIIQSSTGCQQGDPLGPAIFSLGINDVVQSLTSDLNLWYLDDGTLGGVADTVIGDLIILKEKFKELSLELNTTKCEAYILPHVSMERKEKIESKLNDITPGINFLSESNLCLLGAPLNESSVEAILKKKLKKLKLFLERQRDLHPHVALYLIQHSLWIPRLTYLLRCTPLFKFKHLLINMDTKIRHALETIINIKFTEDSWIQCSLPVKYGGIGIRSCVDLATPAFLSSIYSTKSLIGSILNSNDLKIAHLEDAFLEWKLSSSKVSTPENSTFQSSWDQPIIAKRIENITNTLETDKSRMLALTRPESGAWLHAIPSKNLGTILDKTTLRIAISLRIGGKICKPYTCVCGSIVTANGIHGLSCNKVNGRYSRHAAMNGIIKRALNSAGAPSILEPTGLIREDGKRADGMTIFPWKKGKSLVWDATCVDTLAQSYIKQTSKVAGAAANLAEKRKIKLYKSIMIDHEFIPFAVETLGPYSVGARKFVDELGKLLITSSGDPRSKSFFIQRISIEIQRGNAASILATIPPSKSLNELFYL